MAILYVCMCHLIVFRVILEIDPQALIPRLPRRQRSESASPDIPLAEQTLTQAFQTAKYWKDQLLKG